MKRVFICSPYAGDTEKNVANVKRYCKAAVDEGAIPIAPHLYFTQFLDDDEAGMRETGIAMGIELMLDCLEVRVFGSHMSSGMRAEIIVASRNGIPVVFYDK